MHERDEMKREMLMQDARRALEVPASKANDNCVQDAQWRLRDVLDLAGRYYTSTEPAPDYVVRSVLALRSWL
jgi:hypothetical protein